MTADEFWKLIEDTREDVPEEHVESLIAELVKRGQDGVLGFARWWYEFHAAAYSWDLWGAAYILNGGCSDDGFIDFRSWLLLQGRKVYEAALKKPDSLASVDVEIDEASCECYPAPAAWEKAGGGTHDELHDALEKARGMPRTEPELGEGWDFDDESIMKKRYPQLWKKANEA
jgi:hypothetical protein